MSKEKLSSAELVEEIFESSNISPGRYNNPSLPLTAYEGPKNGSIEVPQDDIEALTSIITWETPPPFSDVGRSCNVFRNEPLDVEGGKIYGYKMKGVGNCEPLGENGPREPGVISPPSLAVYQAGGSSEGMGVQERIALASRKVIHMGINEDGSFRPIADKDKPLGGLNPGRGQNEFEIARKLYESGIGSCPPVLWGVYPELLWEGKPLEFVVLGLPSLEKERIGKMFEPAMNRDGVGFGEEMRRAIDESFEQYNPSKLGVPALKVSKKIGLEIGKIIRQAHDVAGVGRFAFHTGNFQYVAKERKVILHDYDSAVVLDSLDSNIKGLTKVRDLESAVFGFFHSIAFSHLYYLLDNDGKFRKDNPIIALLKGYFGGDVESIDEEVWNRVEDEITEKMIASIKLRSRVPIIEKQTIWMKDLNENFPSFLLEKCFELYAASSLSEVDKLPYGVDELKSNMAKYKELHKKKGGEAILKEFQKDPFEIRMSIRDMLKREGMI